MNRLLLGFTSAASLSAGLVLGLSLHAASQGRGYISPTVKLEFSHLSPLDQEKISSFLAGMTSAAETLCKQDSEAWRSVEEYFENEGFVLADVRFSRAPTGRDSIVVRSIAAGRVSAYGYYTEDIPLFFPRLSSGIHLVRKSIIGGPDEIIADGKIHSFALATWENWPPR